MYRHIHAHRLGEQSGDNGHQPSCLLMLSHYCDGTTGPLLTGGVRTWREAAWPPKPSNGFAAVQVSTNGCSEGNSCRLAIRIKQSQQLLGQS